MLASAVRVDAALNPATTRVERFETPEGKTVGAILMDVYEALIDADGTRVFLDGEPVARELWETLVPQHGSTMLVRVVPSGGDDPEGAKVLRSVLMIGITALSLGVGSVWGAVTAVGGYFAVDALVPMPQLQVDTPSGAADSDGLRRTPALSGSRNSMSPYGPVPIVLGKHRVTPPLGAQPYTELDQSDQFLRMVLIPGYGPLSLSDPRIGETPLENFSDVQTEMHDGSNDGVAMALFPDTVAEDSFSVLLKETTGWVTRRTQEDIDEIGVEITFPRGLVKLENDGRKTSRQVDIEAEYREVGGVAWKVMGDVLDVPLRSFDTSEFSGGLDTTYSQIVIDKRSGRLSILSSQSWFGSSYYPGTTVPDDKYIVAIIKRRWFTGLTIEDVRDPALTQYGAGHFLPTNAPDAFHVQVAAGKLDVHGLSATGRSASTIRKGVVIKVDRDQYDVRIKRTTADSTADNVLDEVYWTALRSITNEDPVSLSNVAKIALRIKATDQLQGVVDQFNILAHSVVKDWDSGTSAWVERATSNPASLYRHLLQGPMNKRAVADARIDLTALQAWHEWCEANSHEFNGVINFSSTLLEVLRDVASVGRASPTMKDGLFSVVQDVSQSTPRQLFTPKNSSGFNASRGFPDLPHALKIQFVNGMPTHELTATPASVEVGDVFDLVFGTVTLASFTAAAATVANVTAGLKAAWDASSEEIAGYYDATDDTTHLTLKANRPSAQYNITSEVTNGGAADTQTLTMATLSDEGSWERDEIIVYDDGYDSTNATKFEEVTLLGVVNAEQAWKVGRYYLAVARLRPEVYTLRTDVEHIVCNRGDLVRVQHDVPLFGLSSGRVTARTVVGVNVTTITLDEAMTMVGGSSYAVRYRQEDMAIQLENVDTDAGEQITLTFSGVVAIADAPAVGDLVSFGEQGSETVEMIVHQIEMGPELTAKLTLIDAAPAVHTADAGTIPVYTPGVTSTPELRDLAPATPEIVSMRSGEFVMVRHKDGRFENVILVTIRPGVSGAVPTTTFEGQFRKSDKPKWKTLPNLPADAAEYVLVPVSDGEIYDFRVRAVSQWGTRSAWVTESDHTVAGAMETGVDFLDIYDAAVDIADGSIGNAVIDNNVLFTPIDMEETWAEHFSSRGWANIQAQIDAGYLYYIQPTKPTGGQSCELPDPAESGLAGAWLNSGVQGSAEDWSRAGDDMTSISGVESSDYQPVATAPTTNGHSWDASSELGGGWAAWRAAAADPNLWLAAAAPPQWWEYTPDVPICVVRVNVRALKSAPNRGPEDFTIQGWDGISWTILKTVTGEVGWGAGEFRSFEWDNVLTYAKYRIDITDMDAGIVEAALEEVEWFRADLPEFRGAAGATFNGTTNYLRHAASGWNSDDVTGSITALVRSHAIGAAQTIFASADETTDLRYLKLSINAAGKLEISQRNNDVADVVEGSTVLVADTWYLVSCVCTPGGWILSIDDEVETLTVTSGANTAGWFSGTDDRDNATIGGLAKTSLTEPFDGDIKDVRYYSSRLLARSELDVLWESGRGSWESEVDFGSVLYNAKVALAITLDKIDNVTVTPSISVSTDRLTWIDYVGSGAVNVTNFRYMRVRYDFEAGDDASFVIVSTVQLSITAQTRSESTVVALVAGDAGGTTVTFTAAFQKVLSIMVTPEGTGARYCVVDFDYTQDNPTTCKILMFDEDGIRASGDATYTARGY